MISIHALVKRATIERLNELFKDDISIHALVKRATYPPRQLHCLRVISIHALVKRATTLALITLYKEVFQSTPS